MKASEEFRRDCLRWIEDGGEHLAYNYAIGYWDFYAELDAAGQSSLRRLHNRYISDFKEVIRTSGIITKPEGYEEWEDEDEVDNGLREDVPDNVVQFVLPG